MQLEMEAGGTPLFFDLFVAMVNHLVSLDAECFPFPQTDADGLTE
jgi:hypothetical protein